MKISETYSHLNGLEFLQFKALSLLWMLINAGQRFPKKRP